METTELPENRSERGLEPLSAALKLADHLLSESSAVILGKLGGKKIAERGAGLLPKVGSKAQDARWWTPMQDRERIKSYDCAAAYCLHFAYYNFCRIHRSLRVMPAMETGITDHVWELAELLA